MRDRIFNISSCCVNWEKTWMETWVLEFSLNSSEELGLFIYLFVFTSIPVYMIGIIQCCDKVWQRCHTVCAWHWKIDCLLSSLSLIRLSEQAVSCAVLQSLCFHFLLFHSSVLEPDFHLSGSAKNRIQTCFYHLISYLRTLITLL